MHQGALFRPPVSATAVNELPEHCPDTLQVGNLLLDGSHLACGAVAYVIRGTAGRHTEIEQIPDLGEAETRLECTTPRALFARPELAALEYGFSVSADGRRFLIPTRNPDASAREINVVLNWFEELKAKAKQ
jgi:hypothetical protein